MKKVLAVSAIAGAAAGAAALWVAWQHNNQSELIETLSGEVDWSYAAMIFVSWFALIGGVVFALGAGFRVICRLSRLSASKSR